MVTKMKKLRNRLKITGTKIIYEKGGDDVFPPCESYDFSRLI